MKRLDRIARIKKIASKAGSKAAKGMNFILNQQGQPLAFSEDGIMEIFGITLDSGFDKMTTAQEKQFLELGWYLTGKSSDLSSIKDFMMSKNAAAGFLLENYPWYDDGSKEIFSNPDNIKGAFGALVNHTNEYHEALKEKSQDAASKEYKSNEVVYNFDDGWRVVYVPAAGEMEPYPGFPQSSYDRVLEGNNNGLCLGTGENNPLYQNNSSGKIYSLRDPKNKPKVTFRINNKELHEAKGRFNGPPDVVSTIHAKTWLENIFSQGNLKPSYKDSTDYKSFPPTTLDSARDAWLNDQEKFLESSWAFQWYNQGLTEFDDYIDSKATVLELVSSGLIEKNPKKFEEVVKSNIESDTDIFRFFIQDRTPIWSIYKDRDWMKSAVKDSIENDGLNSIDHKLYQIKDYQDYFLLPKGDGSVLKHAILENGREKDQQLMKSLLEIPKFRDIAKSVLENFSKQYPDLFFRKYRGIKNSDIEQITKVALENMAKTDQFSLFSHMAEVQRLNLTHLVDPSEIKRFIESNTLKSIELKIYKITDYQDYFLLPKGDGSILKHVIIEGGVAQSMPLVMDSLLEIPKFKDVAKSALEDFAKQYPDLFISKYRGSKNPDIEQIIKVVLESLPTWVDSSSLPICLSEVKRLNLNHLIKPTLEKMAEIDGLILFKYMDDLNSLNLTHLINPAIEKMAEENPRNFLDHVRGLPSSIRRVVEHHAANSIKIALESMAKREWEVFNLLNYTDEIKRLNLLQLLETAFKNIANLAPIEFLNRYEAIKVIFFNLYPSAAEIINLQKIALESLALKNPEYFLRRYEVHAKQLGLDHSIIQALKTLANNNPDYFINNYKEEARRYGLNPDELVEKRSYLYKHLVKLSYALESVGMLRESKKVRSLIS